ncbi:hypothetical protein CLV24_105169 [Pontibacter ummariensis]|uniref:Uncharacterized protein n=1 Tax=Pontibacter ummariensis TaxID=1610492 RepID=A0A239DSU3_9BACT|nr:hypothetical protein [Pontibacter ummariensis]PRY13799.1 hypothetical protein CLV24_105169 [Pontibacter ummariensis]SNS34813.1 hypothetical protein SAMN06296052_10583 [Pontibacter ummariensis]
MTDVSTDHPGNIPYVELLEEGRKISFRRDFFGEIRIQRKVNDGEWKVLAERVRSPYVDAEDFPPGTRLSYAVGLELDNEKHSYELVAVL